MGIAILFYYQQSRFKYFLPFTARELVSMWSQPKRNGK